ncbi:glycosyltransferase [Chlorogloeopsis sp. ULAP01]|uniref:O-linked N-acetylglucosamine transferase family protein n=1 Tax=Chlorogloeopsis sp. ULAP01 TaxID=3056483 RepID=UPI0025AA7D43|nr:glycosyltransferase [Chlorogloeopsis sp. ULAP01]MDM9379952.1 glycosyltransferase [Chlorogloeopsis sp. ULAP01]
MVSNNTLKLHLGCGGNVKEGYLNVDQYFSAQDIIQIDIFNIPLENNSVDEIFTEHMLEHLSKYEVPIALKEWARVLKPSGKLVMNLPNLEWCLQQWLIKPEEERWGWQLDTIFGLQTHPGEFHKTGFTKPHLSQLLKTAGFREININDYWSHEQSCFWVEANKGEQINEKEEVLKNSYNFSDVAIINANTHKIKQYLKTNFISIVVPWWDHSDLLEIWKQNLQYLGNLEIIFVDNGSQLTGKLELQEFCNQYNIKLIRNEENRGFSAANNQGAKAATGEYILFLNNDVEILNFPSQLLCALAGSGISGPGFMQNELGEIYIEGWAMCIKKSTLEALGGWCEDYGPGYWDDVDLCHRARLGGYSLTPVPDLHRWMQHKQNTTGRDGRLNQIALHIRNRGIFVKKHYSLHPKIVVDGVFFQLYQTGIARVWKSLLEEWANNSFGKHIIVLDRAGTAPKIPGIRYRTILAYDYANTDADREMLQQVCDEEDADLFISSYYTTPTTTPSVFMAYDMIPEVMGWDMNNPMWQEKHQAIQHASAYITISENTARDLAKFFTDIPLESVTVAYCGVKRTFSPAKPEEINTFKTKYGISKPYFILVGLGSGYKNSILFFQAFSQLATSYGFDIICTGSGGVLAPELRTYTSGSTIHMLQLDDEELTTAYSGAVALVYPSKYEGFGLPVLEAMACGCPVITCHNASIPEVVGEAAIYVKDDNVQELANALCEMQKPSIRNTLITAGLEQAKKFSWSKMADAVSTVLINTTLAPLNLKEINLIIFPDWSQPEESLSLELERVWINLAAHPDSKHITLLIETSNCDENYAEMLLSAISMNLLMQEDLDVSEGLEISLVGQLGDIQWQALLPKIKARIILEQENKQAVALTKAETLPSYNLENFCDTPSGQFFFELSQTFFQQGRWQEAINQYQKLLAIQPGDPEDYWRLSECYRQLNLVDKAFVILQEGIKLYPTDGNLHFSLIKNLQQAGRIQNAISSAITASNILPDDYTFKIYKHLIVPIIYEKQDEISFYRKRFIQGLQNLIQETSLNTDVEKKYALAGIGSLTNFYISYQAQNDIELQRQYGKLVHEIMAANYPQWVTPVSIPPLKPGNKIRIGYVSNYLHSYSGTLWLTGWLRYCDRNSFEIYCYYTGNSPDLITQQFQAHSDAFHHIPHNLEAVCQQIIADQLHILVYPEIGMDPPTMQIAGLRLAPIQCTAWGHPVTTGLPTIDYFLSSELMESENAQEHYSEKLIRLPNIGVSYPKPYIPPIIKTRSDYQLPEDAVIYLCCQAPFKYLPQYDFILAEIACRLPQAKFLFLRGGLLRERLNRAFTTVNLKYEDYCLFLTIPERLDYLMINLLSDVYLDTFTWSGGNTSLEAIACHLPIVTCPGEFMRGRHTYSFLQMIGVTDTIAQNEAEYIDIAVKLGLDSAWGNSIAKKMKERHHLLFDDKVCVEGLEAFYKQLVEESLKKSSSKHKECLQSLQNICTNIVNSRQNKKLN